MPEDISKQAIADAIENIRQASIHIENAKAEINSTLNGQTFEAYINVLNDIVTKINSTKTSLEQFV